MRTANAAPRGHDAPNCSRALETCSLGAGGSGGRCLRIRVLGLGFRFLEFRINGSGIRV